jgi:sugar lactone lactonase YvrE
MIGEQEDVMAHPVGSSKSYSVRRSLRHSVALFVALASVGATRLPAAGAAQFGDVETFAGIPAMPGFPEGISVRGSRVYVSAPAMAGTAGTGPSRVFVYKRRSGAQTSEIVVSGEDLSFEHALSCNAVDRTGGLYVLTAQLFAPPFARLGMLRFRKHGQTYVQETYSDPFPNLPTCVFGPLPVSCSLPNDLAFAADGTAYVTDSFQAAIWRVPPGGGPPQVWFQSLLLAGAGPLPIGANGIRLDPGRSHVYVSVTFSASDPAVGTIYRIPLVDEPEEAEVEVFHQYTRGEAPDGFAFGRSGKLYVTLAGSNEISVLAPDGTETARIASAPGDSIPLDGPANIAFEDSSRSLLVTNHASLSGNAAHFAVLKVFVNDTADPLEKPVLP